MALNQRVLSDGVTLAVFCNPTIFLGRRNCFATNQLGLGGSVLFAMLRNGDINLNILITV